MTPPLTTLLAQTAAAPIVFTLNDLSALAQALVPLLRMGDVLTLDGPLGSGKTTLCQHVLGTLGIPIDQVTSPTYTLVHTYDVPDLGPLWHMDLYRLQHPDELFELGVDEALHTAVCLIEWSDRLGPLMPPNRLELHLAFDPNDANRRLLTFTPHGDWKGRLSRRPAMDPAHLAQCLQATPYATWPATLAAADASHRAYWRLGSGANTVMAMLAPPHLEDTAPFCAMAQLLQQHGVHAPEVVAAYPEVGVLILEDLGTTSYRQVIEADPQQMQPLYEQLVDVLHRVQGIPGPGALGPYDAAAFWRETQVFLDWYLPHYGVCTPTDRDLVALEALHAELIQEACDVPQGVVLRDAMIDNFMLCPTAQGLDRCGVLDFQDALWGPVTYDMASVLHDARFDVPSALVPHLMTRWLTAFPSQQHTALQTSLTILAAQRNLKILGVFTRLDRRDHKPRYLSYFPRLHALLAAELQHPRLAPLKDWVQRFVTFPL